MEPEDCRNSCRNRSEQRSLAGSALEADGGLTAEDWTKLEAEQAAALDHHQLEPPKTKPPPPDADPWAAGITHLLGMAPLPGFDGSCWRRICLDCAALLELWGSEMHRLGWSAADAFGVHPDAPYWAYQCMGLGVLLKGGTIVQMTETGAKIECLSGVQHSFVRRCRPGAVPIWTAGNLTWSTDKDPDKPVP